MVASSIAGTLWAYASLGYAAPSLFRPLALVVRERLGEISAQVRCHPARQSLPAAGRQTPPNAAKRRQTRPNATQRPPKAAKRRQTPQFVADRR